jgi:hypothetical protein
MHTPIFWQFPFFSSTLFVIGALLCTGTFTATAAFAHSPICNCYNDDENGDKVICEGGFSDGGSAKGVGVKVLNDRDRVLIKGAMNADSTFTFTKPDDDFHILYDAGPSHQVIIYMDDIE